MKNIRKKMFSLILLACFLLSFIIGFIPPQKVSAASTDLTDRISDRLKLEAFDKCLDDLSEELPKGDVVTPFGSITANVPPDINPSGRGISVGYVVDAENAQWICGTKSHAEEWFKLIGYNSLKDFRDSEYKSKDDNKLTAKNGIDKLRSKIRGKINDARGKLPLRDEHRYYIYLTSFEHCAEGPKSSANDISGHSITIDNFITKDGKKIGKAYFQVTEEDEISVGHGFGPADGRLNCEELAAKLRDSALSSAYAAWVDANGGAPEVAGTDGTGDTQDSCEQRTLLSSGWIVCGLLELLSSGMDRMVGVIDDLLNVDATKIGNDTDLQTIWSYFRGIATFALVAVGLVMIISQAIGGGN